MGGERQPISFAADESILREIDSYQERSTAETRSQAIAELVRIGLREQRAPILYRWRDSVADVALIFTCVAVSTLIIGMATSVVTWRQAVPVAAAFAVVALALIAAVEVARAVNGQSDLGDRLRRAV